MKTLQLIQKATIKTMTFCYVNAMFLIGMTILLGYAYLITVNCLSEYGVSAYRF